MTVSPFVCFIMRRARWQRWCMLAVLALFSSVPLMAAGWIGAYRHDDAYITLTFARNVASGAGFVYNGGSAVLGTTTPLMTLLVAGLSFFLSTVSLLTIATFLTVLAWIATAWILAALWEKLEGDYFGVLIAILFLTQPGYGNLLGVEMLLFQFLLVATVYLYLNARMGWSGLGAGLASLTRGEGLLLGLILALISLIARRRAPWKFMLSFGTVILTWGVYSFFAFGSPLPNTLAAKIAQRESGLFRDFGQRLFSEWIPNWFLGFPLLNIGVIALVFAGFGYCIWRRREWLIFAIWWMSYVAGYLLIAPAGYWWYAVPVFFVASLLNALGIAGLPKLIGQIFPSNSMAVHVLRLGIILIVVGIAIFNIRNLNSTLATYSANVDPLQGRYYAGYKQAAEWFVKYSQPNETIAYVEIGYLGFYTRNRFVDLTGLVTPSIIAHFRSRDLLWGFLNHRSDYVILVPEFDWLLADLRLSAEFQQNYQLVYQIQRLGREPLSIYARWDSSYMRLYGGN
jgi:hypothetical protein